MKSTKTNVLKNNNKSKTELKSPSPPGSSSIVENLSPKNNDIAIRLVKLENLVEMLSNQNEILSKKLDEFEKSFSKEGNYNLMSDSNNKSFISTNNNSSNNTSNDCSSDIINNSENYELKKEIDNNKINEINNQMFHISNYISGIDKKCEDNTTEMNHMKSAFEEVNTTIIEFSKKLENLTKFEKLIHELLNKINKMKNHNSYWQADFLKNMNDFNEKIMNQEILLDQLEKFEKVMNTKIEYLINEVQKQPKLIDSKIDEIYKLQNLKEQNMNEKLDSLTKNNLDYKDEITKHELNIKSLWDSFTFFSHSLNNSVI